MGWLGWSYDQTLDTPMPVIELAMRGLYERLAAIHGGSTTAPPAPEVSEAVSLSDTAGAMAIFRSAATPPKR